MSLLAVGCGRLAVPVQGSTSSGGGDGVELDFRLAAHSLARRLQSDSPDTYRRWDFDHWLETIDKAQVVVVDAPLEWRGRSVTAINYPDAKLLKISRPRWLEMDGWQHERIALHEGFGLAGIEDKNYRLTYEILRKLAPAYLAEFRTLTFGGAVARALVRALDWVGGRSVDLGTWRLSAIRAADTSDFLYCLTGTEPFCTLQFHGQLEGGKTAVVSAPRNGDHRFDALWKRLGGVENEGFEHVSILGYWDPEWLRRVIRLRLE